MKQGLHFGKRKDGAGVAENQLCSAFLRNYSASELAFALKAYYFFMESENQEYDMIEIITADINKLEDKSCVAV